MRKKGNMNLDENSEYSGDEDVSRIKKEKRDRPKRKKSGILKVGHRDNGE